MSKKLDREDLAMLYNETDRLYQELSALADQLFDVGLEETSSSLGVDDAMKGLGRTLFDLDLRIEIKKKES